MLECSPSQQIWDYLIILIMSKLFSHNAHWDIKLNGIPQMAPFQHCRKNSKFFQQYSESPNYLKKNQPWSFIEYLLFARHFTCITWVLEALVLNAFTKNPGVKYVLEAQNTNSLLFHFYFFQWVTVVFPCLVLRCVFLKRVQRNMFWT